MKFRHVMNNREEKVMEYLWEKNEPMTISDLEKLLADEGLGKASIFKAVQALTKCNYIDVSGAELVKRTYARQLKAAITREQYAAILLMERGFDWKSLGGIALAMTGANDGNKGSGKEKEKLIKELEGIIAQLREEK